MNPKNDDLSDPSWRKLMSELADGELESPKAALEGWTSRTEARQAWYEYHLIGDVLRSEDLALPPARDESLLAAIRARMAAEPVILAPSAGAEVRAGAPASRRWAVAAATAGVMMVGGAAFVLRSAPQENAGLAAALSPPPGALASSVGTRSQGTAGAATQTGLAAVSGSASAALGDPQWRVIDGQTIRDARLDAYLRAHRGTAAARPGAVAGRFETVVLER
jgi:sigma-E factor negative regulatory protein RseA